MHLTTYNYHSISYHLKMSLVIFEYIWYISNHTCVWHCHWADMFARQCWSGETSLGRIIADQWSRMRITFDRRMFQCDRLQSQRTLDQRCFVLWRMWLRTVTVSICQHVGLKFSACSRAVPRNLLSWDTEKCAPCFLFSRRVMNGGIELSRPSLFLPLARPWQAEQILWDTWSALSFEGHCIILQSGQRCWPNMARLYHAWRIWDLHGFAILQIDMRTPELGWPFHWWGDAQRRNLWWRGGSMGAPSAKGKGLRNAHLCHWPDPFSNVYNRMELWG